MSTFREFMLEVGCVLDWHLMLCMHCPQVKGLFLGLISNDNNAVSNKSACYIISHWYICSSFEPYDSSWFNDGCLAMGEVTFSRLLVGIEPQQTSALPLPHFTRGCIQLSLSIWYPVISPPGNFFTKHLATKEPPCHQPSRHQGTPSSLCNH